jgi:hypothetical protein
MYVQQNLREYSLDQAEKVSGPENEGTLLIINRNRLTWRWKIERVHMKMVSLQIHSVLII